MLSAQAYSFRQKSRLAITLSWVAGYTNVISLLALGAMLSHVTGNLTHAGESVLRSHASDAVYFGSMVLAFLAGAAGSGVFTELARRRGWPSKYALPIAIEAALLTALMISLRTMPEHARPHDTVPWLGAVLGSLAMGLQNATITQISGSVIRTTHLTGIFTDLGLEGVQYVSWWMDQLLSRRSQRASRAWKVSRRHPSALRLALLASIAGSFLFGVLAGTYAFVHLPSLALLAPVAFLLWVVFVDCTTPIADVREMDLLSDPELNLQGMLRELLPRELGLYRFACRHGNTPHRAPNFQQWIERIPDHIKVIILAVSPLTRFDDNAVLDLEQAVRKLRSQGRWLVISGIAPAQFHALETLDVQRVMNVHNICPDLEFAIARGLALLADEARPAALGESRTT